MPELPEVECVRQSVAPRVVRRKVRAVHLLRRDVVRGPSEPADLLAGGEITGIDRLGKQLALVGHDGRCVCVHLGMTGSLRWSGPSGDRPEPDGHTHVIWRLEGGVTLAFRDPRRFGGLWTFPCRERLLDARWSVLGEDALRITPARLHQRLTRTSRPIKAALLDQHVVAGLGNIYVDELLFACGVHPLTPTDRLGRDTIRGLVRRMRTLLARAIAGGGSTLRDYVAGDGARGRFQHRHRVYSRAGLPCRRCRRPLESLLIAGRTSVFCTSCQRR